ncbi:MAG: glucose-6-phosphate isomerase [Puniceicoccales bacterium]|jgi:glucose-6-phosphate isomerase|nr:glucose-6-phosphate isomerase [Puniceicoccales bacterium]
MDQWQNFEKYFFRDSELGISVDFNGVGFPEEFFSAMAGKISTAYREMAALEAGAIVNGDENRMVGHYWLRNSTIAPSGEIRDQIDGSIEKILQFSAGVRCGRIIGQGGRFENVLCIGIGGSALGPQLLCESLCNGDGMDCFFMDNTDPDGIDIILGKLAGKLGKTIVIVASKSGSTPEPCNAMIEAMAAYGESGYTFQRHAVAVTCENSQLDRQAVEEGWLERFAMWEWVGGRNSVFSAVGLLPAALHGISIESLIGGARRMDELTRMVSAKNPSMMMALAWYLATSGTGSRDMVVIPYKDRLLRFTRYLQQIVMESLGKESDRAGNIVHQGLTVYGNKGSTDQHSLVQQLRDGLQNFFLTVIDVLKSRDSDSIGVDADGMTSGDYLNGFALGTMGALAENGTKIIHISLDKLSARELGGLIAVFERAVGFYGSMVGINAYNQPGVEAGKKAATEILRMQRSMVKLLRKNAGQYLSVQAIADSIGTESPTTVFKILEHMCANDKAIRKMDAKNVVAITYGIE